MDQEGKDGAKKRTATAAELDPGSRIVVKRRMMCLDEDGMPGASDLAPVEAFVESPSKGRYMQIICFERFLRVTGEPQAKSSNCNYLYVDLYFLPRRPDRTARTRTIEKNARRENYACGCSCGNGSGKGRNGEYGKERLG